MNESGSCSHLLYQLPWVPPRVLTCWAWEPGSRTASALRAMWTLPTAGVAALGGDRTRLWLDCFWAFSEKLKSLCWSLAPPPKVTLRGHLPSFFFAAVCDAGHSSFSAWKTPASPSKPSSQVLSGQPSPSGLLVASLLCTPTPQVSSMNRCVTQVSTTTAQQPSLTHFLSAPSKIRALNLFPACVCVSKWQMAERVKRQPKMRETQVRSLGREDPLEKGMATLSSILAWRIPWTEEPGGLQPIGSQSGTRLSDFTFSVCVFVCVRVWVASTDFWCLPSSPCSGSRWLLLLHYPPRPPLLCEAAKARCLSTHLWSSRCLPLQARPCGGRSGFWGGHTSIRGTCTSPGGSV